MDTNSYTINPETGRQIRIGGILFCQLLYDRYDYLNGELVRRANASSPEPRQYFYNTITHRRVIARGRRYYELLNAGWEIEEDYYLVPPEVISDDYYPRNAQTLPDQIQNPLPTYKQIMDIYRERLTNLNITLCRECFSAIKLEEGEYCNECISH